MRYDIHVRLRPAASHALERLLESVGGNRNALVGLAIAHLDRAAAKGDVDVLKARLVDHLPSAR